MTRAAALGSDLRIRWGQSAERVPVPKQALDGGAGTEIPCRTDAQILTFDSSNAGGNFEFEVTLTLVRGRAARL